MSLEILFALAFFNLAFTQHTDDAEAPPNVLFIIADDLNATLSSYDKEGVFTPNLDRLAQRSVKFERAYCQAPLCNPSRASMMTGQRTNTLKIWNNEPHFREMYPKIQTLPQYFKESGYHTVGIGKIYHNWGQEIKGDPQSWSEPQKYHYAAHYHDWYVPGRPYTLHFDLKKGPAVQQEDVPDPAYLDGRIANDAINKMRELQEAQFFLAVGFWKPHLPYNAPKKYWDLYDRNNLPAVRYPNKVEGIPDIAYVNSDEVKSYKDINKTTPLSEEKKNQLRHGYLAAISYLDAQVGKLLDELEKLNLNENTIVVFTSDHGYHAGEHGQFGKWTNFEIGSRVPFMISVPGSKAVGKVSNSLVELIDLYPTLLELCNISSDKLKTKLDGKSLVPIINDPNATIKPAAISQVARPLGGVDKLETIGTSMRTDRYRYNAWVHQRDKKLIAEELYDLSNDLYNADNLIGNPEYETIKKQLRAKLKAMIIN